MAEPEFRNLKDPGATLGYGFDWSDWLVGADIVSSASWEIPAGLTRIGDSVLDDTDTVIILSGGTVGTVYQCVCHVVTQDGLEDERTLNVICKQR